MALPARAQAWTRMQQPAAGSNCPVAEDVPAQGMLRRHASVTPDSCGPHQSRSFNLALTVACFTPDPRPAWAVSVGLSAASGAC